MKKVILILGVLLFIIACSEKKLPDLGNGYKFVKSSSLDLGIVDSTNSFFIEGHILDYAFDSTYIIVFQKPRDIVRGDITSTLSDEAFARSTFRQYWIINKKGECDFIIRTKLHANVYGPFNKEEFLLKRKELGVPDNLKFENKE